MIEVGSHVFLDTNVLLTATDRARPAHEDAKTIVAEARRRGFSLFVSGQILREYLVVATRPQDVNGLGMTVADAIVNVDSFCRRLACCDETEAVSRRLQQLVRELGLQGKRIHDANVAATMQTHGIDVLITDNPNDFSSFPELTTLGITAAAEAMPSRLDRLREDDR